ncbi:MAG: hypothetical protein JXL80_09385 [Planctomycetes bacterium]|nr:hypothetical protein [Planctomycetota bacterium]
MSSSISSFERPIPVRGGWRLVILALAAAVVPLAVADAAIRQMGFVYAPKTALTWYELATGEPPRDRLAVAFYGSSRVNLGFSPDDFDAEVGRLGGRSSSLNLGLDGHTAGAGALVEERSPYKRDILIMELDVATPLSAMEEKTLRKAGRVVLLDRINNSLGIWIDRHMVLHRFRTVVAYLTGNMTTRQFIYHDDGWNEAHYDDGGFRIERVREARRRAVERLEAATAKSVARPPDPAIVARWQRYADMLQDIRRRKSCQIVLVRMPLGPLARREIELLLKRFDPMTVLGRLEGVLVIDGDRDLRPGGYEVADESHMTASEARAFSADLARAVYPWYAARHPSP